MWPGFYHPLPTTFFPGAASDVEEAEKHVKVREVLVMKSWKTIALAIALIGAAGAGAAVAPATFAQSTTPRVAVAPQAELFSIGGGRIGVSIRDVDGSDKTKAAAGS